MSRRTFGDMERDNYAHEVGWFERQTPLGLIAKSVGLVLVLSLVFGGIGFVAGWFKTGADVVSPENVKKQWEFAYTYDKSLTAAANNWCTAKKLESKAIGDDAKNERMSQTTARESTYNNIKAAFDAKLANAFEAKLVKPNDVPDHAPTLEQKVNELQLVCE